MRLTESHDCEKEYWQHCIQCVSGDPDATFEYIGHDALGICIKVKIYYPDGSSAMLVRGVDGWGFLEPHSTDCATAAGMYDP